jgi:hypothetical protein
MAITTQKDKNMAITQNRVKIGERELALRNRQIQQLTENANSMIITATTIQKNIDSAKTRTKRDFYNKKMSKLRDGLQQTLATIQLLKIMTGQTDASTKNSEPQKSV